MAAICHIGFLKKVSLDHSARCGLPLSTYIPNLADTLIGSGKMHQKRNLKKWSDGRILHTVSRLMPSLIQGPLCVSSCKISAKSDNRRRVMAIQIIQDGRHLPPWLMEKSIFGPFRTLRDSIIYIHTKSGEDILISGEDMPSKLIFFKRPLAVELYIWFNFDVLTRSGTSLCVSMQRFSQIGQSAAKLW